MRNFENLIKEIKDITKKRTPDFNNILKVLARKTPDRFTLFEFFLNPKLEESLAGYPIPQDETAAMQHKIKAFQVAGYDYCTMHSSSFYFAHNNNDHNKSSISVNEGGVVSDRQSYEGYTWNNPGDYYNGRLEKLAPFLPEGMKFMVPGPGGVLENVTAITGYDNLCYMTIDDPELVEELFKQVGTRMLDYYKQIVDLDCVGAIISNDDWGFNTQTMLSPQDMRKYVFPWHKKITGLVHKAGKPVILHSCGNLATVMEDIISDMQYDGKHSYEDKILPVEQAYQEYKGKIAVMGGIDLDFVCRETPQSIYDRSRSMLEQATDGGYALGSGNSIPGYVPHDNYYAMIMAALQP